jgi:hypothetical protein
MATRQAQRAETRRMEKQARRIPADRQKLEKDYIKLAQIVGEMQISLNAIYSALIEKGALTQAEFLIKHREILENLSATQKGGQA